MGRKVRSFLTAFLQRTKTKTVFPCLMEYRFLFIAQSYHLDEWRRRHIHNQAVVQYHETVYL